jgi:hypothetical protein
MPIMHRLDYASARESSNQVASSQNKSLNPSSDLITDSDSDTCCHTLALVASIVGAIVCSYSLFSQHSRPYAHLLLSSRFWKFTSHPNSSSFGALLVPSWTATMAAVVAVAVPAPLANTISFWQQLQQLLL